ncbi:hypothetical protein [Amycolatopsis sp. H20-H5]|uniref:hypothetical protein n=1 Tax=Amycolatopsis sp. H20-H5 TaxID=3046309 RepID=UPI002DBC6181|nr:hypothetical protein [Amycolatopsis sp. H20-H5]MEC3979168.1 hypothetical protein [Amycolatopsis sp. H20-H5]
MKRIAARVVLPIAAAAALTGLAGGIATAAPAPGLPSLPALPTSGAPAIWAVPGLDAGGLLGPSVQAPTQLLAPVFGLITLVS